jgi:predicted  nucleic acid-binding Zn-ribbon protein
VQDLEDEVAGLRTRIGNILGSVEEIKNEEAKRRNKIEEAKAMIEKYTDDQNNVRNNREYDLLAKEIEFQTLEVEFCEKKLRQYAGDLKAKNEEIERTNVLLEERLAALEDKRNELEEIISETKDEEEKLRDRAKVLEATIEPRLLQSFKRIRKNTRNGLGVVYVQRDACGGCFNKIPPQRQLDIKMRKKIIVCEYCGRIMIDPELAGVKETTVQAPEKKTRKRAIRKKSDEAAAE